MIASGHRHDISTEDYILGALMLYIDIIGMFIYILKLLGQGQNN
jgi:FtsH-binding integral membrane protein